MLSFLRDYFPKIEKCLNSYGILFFLESRILGVIILGITLLHPNIGVMGALGILFTLGLLNLISIPMTSVVTSPALRNGLLIGLLLGDLYVLQFKTIIFLILALILNLGITSATITLFKNHQLPVLSFPFAIFAFIIGGLKSKLTFLADATIYFTDSIDLSFLPSGIFLFFKSMGSLYCTPDAFSGALIWLAALFFSPLTGLFLFAGYFIGSFIESFFVIGISLPYRYSDGFNYSLIFTAFAGYFLFPSIFSIVLACCFVAMAAILILAGEVYLAPFNLQIISIPFNIVTLMGLLALKSLKPFSLSSAFFRKPEINLERSRLLWQRHRFGEVGIFLPIATDSARKWKVQQGINGGLTHKGLWQHALDFVCIDAEGKNFINRGIELSDHYTFGADVISPLQGTVVACLGTDEDNNIGQLVNTRNWGNYIIIRGIGGIYVALAHLQKDSLLVKNGDILEVGQKIAKIGNSGYSQTPHLHLQVQWTADIGATTMPFHLLNYGLGDSLIFHGVPQENDIIFNPSHNQAVEQALNFKVDEALIFQTTTEGSSEKQIINIVTKVDDTTGTFFLSDGISRLSFAKVGLQFYFYGLEGNKHSALWDLMAAAPKIPMIFKDKLSYTDSLPAEFYGNPMRRFLHNIFQILKLSVTESKGHYQVSAQGLEVWGTCQFFGKEKKTYIKLDPSVGIQKFSVGDKVYEFKS